MTSSTRSDRGTAARPAVLAAVTLALAVLAAACTQAPSDEALARLSTTTTEAPLDVSRTAREATFRVINRTCFGAGSGSAFLLDGDTLVTNRHVVEGAVDIDVETWDGRVHAATVVDQSTQADLAVIRLAEALPYRPIPVAAATPDIGDPVVVLGYPGNGPYTATTGAVVAVQSGEALGQPFGEILRTDAPVQPGSSGGPVLDEHGELVGVVFALEAETDHSLAVPAVLIGDLLTGQGAEPVRDCRDEPVS